jgi:hypothetical protein
MWQAPDREGALDKKVESRVVSARRHGMGVDSAKALTSVVQELVRVPAPHDVYRKRVKQAVWL